MEFDKLVRDKVPHMIEGQEKVVTVERVSGENYFLKLKEKLQEEVAEFIEDGAVEELADIIEVIYAICAFKDINLEQLEQLRLIKVQNRGAFKQGLVLKEIREKKS